MTQAKKHDFRREPGWASLAKAVIQEERRAGEPLEVIQQSIWAQYLLAHTRAMRGRLVRGHVAGEE